MEYFDSLKKKIIDNSHFPLSGVFLIDELRDIFNTGYRAKLSRKKIAYLIEQITAIINGLEQAKSMALAQKKANQDPIYTNIFFNGGGSPNMEEIQKSFPITKIYNQTFSETFVLLAERVKNKQLLSLKGYELAGIISVFYIYQALKILSIPLTKAKNKKALNALRNEVKQQVPLAMNSILKASEALLLSKTLLLEDKQKTIIDTAKYLIEKANREKEEFKKLIDEEAKEIEKRAIREFTKKGAKKRHVPTNNMKADVIQEWYSYYNEMKAQGHTPSKRRFADIIAERYKDKDNDYKIAISWNTVRNNWLKGLPDP